ncbi:EamA family transporter [Saxibacter everestensis]|uniref:EamA family transporter n=1 Tax=Saxibacter everestensis TaxID=2909229 RepID=A0ABY8QWW3_9MICO|nr:EamA family transporter [Brevibacteriaceae bacterium ZFBP1038]
MSTATSLRTGLTLAVISALTFGVSGPFAKALFDIGWSSGGAALVRMAGAAVVLLAASAVMMRGRWKAVVRRYRLLLAYGVVAVAGVQVCFFNAVQYLSVGVALLLEYLAPVIIVGWLWLRTRIRPSATTLVGTVVAMAGLVLVLDIGNSGTVHPIGLLWGLGAAVGLCCYFILSNKQSEDLPPVVMAGVGMTIGAMTVILLGVTGLLPIVFVNASTTLAGISLPWVVPALGLVLISTVIAYLTGIAAIAHLGPKLSSFVGLTEVLFAVLASWLMLGELPVPIQLLGGALIVAGVVLVRLEPGRRLTAKRELEDKARVNTVAP